MKQFKIIFLLIAIGLLVTNSVFAQDQSKKEIAIQERLDEIDYVYKLKEGQKNQVKKFIVKSVEEEERLKFLDVTSFWELRKAYSKVSRELHDSVKSVLTEKQIRRKSALFYYPRFDVKSDKKVCVNENGSEMATIESKMYRNENIIPTLKIQRKKLESKISTQDKKTITILRQELAEAEKAVKDFKQNNQYDFISVKGLSNQQREDYRKLTDNVDDKRERINALVTKYNKDIDALLGEIEPSMTKWKTELKTIEAKYFPKQVERQNKWTAKEKMEVEKNEMDEFKFDFLILDYNFDHSYRNKMTVETTYFGGSNTVYLELEQSGNITFQLLDKENQILQTILSEHRERGLHVLNIDILDLKNGDYNYLLTTSDNQKISIPVRMFRR